VLAVLVATAVAFVVTERLKLERSPVQRTKVTPAFSPACDCATTESAISFRLRRPERVAIEVVGRGGSVVRELLVSQRLSRGPHEFVWNGRDDAGALAPDGVYRIRLHLARGRTITVPNRIALDTRPPQVRDAGPTRPALFSPDGDGRSDGVKVAYELSEPGQALLYVDGTLRVRTHSTATSGEIAWYGRVGGRTLPPGRYRLTLGTRDLAGNLGGVAPAGAARLRYVALPRDIFRVLRGRRFTVRVSTDARRVAWRLGRRRGVSSPVLHLRAPAAPGRYRLVVRAGRHRARAFVLVRRPR
jgi:hypothetical protein